MGEEIEDIVYDLNNAIRERDKELQLELLESVRMQLDALIEDLKVEIDEDNEEYDDE